MYQSLLAQAGFSIERLANFCAVADAGSIVGAAKGDAVRQSLISRQIRELESFFGTDLILRKGRGIELTGSGRELAAVGRENFKGLADFAARCRGAAWSVKIVASNSVAQWLLLPRLKSLAASMDSVRFEIFHEQTREIVTATREGIYDLAFVRKDALGPGLERRVLCEVGHSLLIPKGLLQKKPKSLASALKTVPLALTLGGRMREQLERIAEAGGWRLRVIVGCSSYLQAAQVLNSGMCATVLPDLALPALKLNQFHRSPLPDAYQLCLAWSKRNADTRPALTGLIECVIEEIKGSDLP